MSVEIDFRNYLTQANTPAGAWIYFETFPQDGPSPFINIRKTSDDGFHTSNPGPGNLTFAVLEVDCTVKGTDQFAQYVEATALAEAVKKAINGLALNTTSGLKQWPATMGNTTVYYASIESISEEARSKGVYSKPYQYQQGKGSGLQRITVPVAINYWNPNS